MSEWDKDDALFPHNKTRKLEMFCYFGLNIVQVVVGYLE